MSKELTPLEALERLCSHLDYDNSDYMHNGSYEEDNEIIENALKRLEIIDKLNEKHCEETQNKLKALEIIEEHLQASCLTTIEKVVVDVVRMTFTHEEFDLLKEVLGK